MYTVEVPTRALDPRPVASTRKPASDRSGAPRGGAAPSEFAPEFVATLDRWRARNRFYWLRKLEYLRFLIPVGESVLLFGCEDGSLLDALRPSRGVGVDRRESMIAVARRRNPSHEFRGPL